MLRRPSTFRTGSALGWAISLTWLATAVVVGLGAWHLRNQIRAQVVGRDGEILLTLAHATQVRLKREGGPVDRPGEVMVEIADMPGIIVSTLHTLDGTPVVAIPEEAKLVPVPKELLPALHRLRPVSRFVESVSLKDLYEQPPPGTEDRYPETIPAVRVYVPLTVPGSGELGALTQYVFEGSAMAREFEALDRRILIQALGTLLAAFGVTGMAVVWPFRRLARTHSLLEKRTADLQRANRELSRSARVAALGAVTAHLMHGLKSPVSGLKSFMESRSEAESQGDEGWEDALAATQRMQDLIQRVARVLQEQETEQPYEVRLREVADAVVVRCQAEANESRVRLEVQGDPSVPIDNRTASLLTLVLANLIENAIQASSQGGVVMVRLSEGEVPICEVEDHGPGLPPEVHARLFQPLRSTKEGGSGLGLAIARQLVLAMGGHIELASSSATGTVFRVRLPAMDDHGAGAAGSSDASHVPERA
ncbi:MAG: HAMP domain-containing histidine kinase [Verrucomicrobiales bacterium]|nr:HAMP domain-containing histidine kinase [Verrucomicrobiales bacterium]